MSFRFLVPVCSQFDREDIEKIVQAGIRIFRAVPWTIDGTPEFMDYLIRFGCRVDGKRVFFPDGVVDKTLEKIPMPSSSSPVQPRLASREISYSTSGQALWCSDPKSSELRAATKKDLADLCRVINSFDGLGRSHPTFIPQDAPVRTCELHALVTIMLNSDKPYRVSAYSPEIVKYFIEALTVYYGMREETLKNLLTPCKVWVNTPFMISRECIEASMELRRLTGAPLVIGSMPVTGFATPVTEAGALALITAEVLGANAISLAVDGRLCGWVASPLSFDMKTGVHNQWGPETITIGTACQHVASYLFGGTPSITATTSVSAKVPGAQSMTERAFGVGMAFMAGIRSFGGLTTLAFSDVGSVVQLMLDMELMSAVEKLARGFDVDDEKLAEEVIKEVAPRGARFLESEHTFKHFREAQWFPELFDRRVTGTYALDPKTMLEQAREKALRLIDTAPNLCPLDESQKRELMRILAAADAELGS